MTQLRDTLLRQLDGEKDQLRRLADLDPAPRVPAAPSTADRR